MLVTTFLDSNATALPSPNQLKRKILLKHKKLATVDGPAMPETPPPIKEGKCTACFRFTRERMATSAGVIPLHGTLAVSL